MTCDKTIAVGLIPYIYYISHYSYDLWQDNSRRLNAVEVDYTVGLIPYTYYISHYSYDLWQDKRRS